MLRDSTEAQDLAQETFTRLCANWHRLRDAEAVLAWIYRTATRLAVDRIRRNQVASNAILGLPDEQPDLRGRLEAREQLNRVVHRLGKRELQALVLSRIDGLTQEEIGTIMKMSDRTVRRLLRKADTRLQRSIETPR